MGHSLLAPIRRSDERLIVVLFVDQLEALSLAHNPRNCNENHHDHGRDADLLDVGRFEFIEVASLARRL